MTTAMTIERQARAARATTLHAGTSAGGSGCPVAGSIGPGVGDVAAGGFRRRDCMRSCRPTSYLLSRPAIERVQFAPASAWAVIVMSRERPGKHRAMSRKPSAPARKRPTAASLAALSTAPQVPPRRATSYPNCRAGNVSRSGCSKCQRRQLAPVQPPRRPRHPLRIRQGVLDRQPHVRRRKLGQHRAVRELDERMNDRFGMDDRPRSARRAGRTASGPRSLPAPCSSAWPSRW